MKWHNTYAFNIDCNNCKISYVKITMLNYLFMNVNYQQSLPEGFSSVTNFLISRTGTVFVLFLCLFETCSRPSVIARQCNQLNNYSYDHFLI